jgi:hypothetical protein
MVPLLLTTATASQPGSNRSPQNVVYYVVLFVLCFLIRRPGMWTINPYFNYYPHSTQQSLQLLLFHLHAQYELGNNNNNNDCEQLLHPAISAPVLTWKNIVSKFWQQQQQS